MSTETDDGDGRTPAALTGLDGDADFGRTARALYATDASIYRAEPAGVVRPASKADVQRTVEYARRHDTSVVARGAGSSLTGAAVGSGIVLDCSRHLDEVIDVDPEGKTATVQPGVVLDELNEALAAEGLYFPPDPSTSSTCTVGGMVANDAAGPHSVRHGTTRDNVRRVECVLADGSVTDFGRRTGDDLRRVCARDDRCGTVHDRVRELRVRHAEEIADRYPSVDRNSSGYDLQTAAAADGSWVDLSKLLVGSEGTLGIVTEVTIELSERPADRAAVLVCYDGLRDAASAVSGALEADPSAVELVDDTVLGHAREAWGIDLVPPEAGAALLVEVEVDAGETIADPDGERSRGSDHGAPADDDVLTRRLEEAVAAARTDATLAVERAIEESAQSTLWTVRKASNPLLNRHPGDEQALSFVEDAAVPPERLPEYLDRVGEILREHDLRASVFGHAGQGVLHVKPFLNLKEEADRERLRAVSAAVHEVVVELGGCVSGEHGDGMLRSQYLPDMYGDELYGAFVAVKRAFDPHDVFNPGKVVPDSDGDLAAVDEGLRYQGYDPEAVETALDFDEERGFGSLVEQCNGCSKCRTETTGVMCPSYRGAEEEVTSTRGRANMLREAIDGGLGEDALTSEWFQREVLDLCLACKACETECPTGVDMAKLKTEAKHQRHRREGVPLRARLFGNVRTLNRVGSALAPVANRLATFGPGRAVLEQALGIDARRSLPAFADESLQSWFAARESRAGTGAAACPETGPGTDQGDRGRVLLFADCYTAYNHPEVGKAAVRVLEALGYRVALPEVACCGRPALSQGLVETARDDAATNVDRLRSLVDEDVPLLTVEPSCASAFDEYDDLLDDPGGLVAQSRTVAEFLRDDVVRGDVDLPRRAPDGDVETVALHGHCHAKAKGRAAAPRELLQSVGYDVRPLDATCCGMAGAFGYEAEHYDLSMRIAEDLLGQLDATEADAVAASGASCTQQLADNDVATVHPLELVAEVVCDA